MAAGIRRFRYTAWDPASGTARHGEITAAEPAAVREDLRGRGWETERIVALEPAADSPWRASWQQHLRRRRRLVVADLCEAIAALVQVGMPLDQALDQVAASPLRAVGEARLLEELATALRAGTSFSDACAAQPAWFDRFDVAVLSAGQRAGELAPVLRAVAEHRQRHGAALHRLVTALAYPAIIAMAGLAVFIFLTQVVLPRIAGILTAARAPLPGLTQAVMQAGDVLMWWWPILVLVVVGAALGMGRLLARVPPRGRFGRLVHGNAWARLRARTRVAVVSAALARLLRAGVPLTEALYVISASVPDRALRDLLASSAAAVERGQDLSTVMAGSLLIEPEFAHMLRLGEGSGDLPGMLERIAETYRTASDRAAERFAAVIGPLAIAFLAVLVGILVLAVGQALSRVTDLI